MAMDDVMHRSDGMCTDTCLQYYFCLSAAYLFVFVVWVHGFDVATALHEVPSILRGRYLECYPALLFNIDSLMRESQLLVSGRYVFNIFIMRVKRSALLHPQLRV